MKIVLAPNAFKGSLSATEAVLAMQEGVESVLPWARVEKIPFSDGGDGLLEAFAETQGGKVLDFEVAGPRWQQVSSPLRLLEDQGTAAIEMARASGLALLPEQRLDPAKCTTYGTGELILRALELNVRKIVLGIGGSATNDGGIGMAAALGFRFLDAAGQEVEPVGGELNNIRKIDASRREKRLQQVEIEVACDVQNLLLGPEGATRVYAPQKGADGKQIEKLEAGMANLADLIRRDLGIDVCKLKGAGAAGGLGAGLYAFAGATLRPGVELMLDVVGMRERMAEADLAITGEGQLDSQVFYGKGPAGVASCAREMGVPCFVLAGNVLGETTEFESLGIQAVFSICPGPCSNRSAMQQAYANLKSTTAQVIRVFAAGREKGSQK